MRREHTDVLVVGMGPAGSAVAAECARRGPRVIAIEKKKQIGVPVQCAEFIPLPLQCHAQADGVLMQRISGMRSRLPSGAVTDAAFSGLMVDRAAFDQALARDAVDAGARLHTGSLLRTLNINASTAMMTTADGELEVAYRVLLAADGPHSTVARLAGLPALQTVDTRQYTVPLLKRFSETDIWLSHCYAGGYAWLFPKGAHANLGLGMDPQFSRDMKSQLDVLHRELVDEGRVGEEILARTGGAIPVSGLRARLTFGNMLFVGDAAGLTHPITGAGIAPAIASGEQAARAICTWFNGDTGALAEYEADIRDQFGNSLTRAVERRRELEQVLNTPRAQRDDVHRRGWIAYPEFFANAA